MKKAIVAPLLLSAMMVAAGHASATLVPSYDRFGTLSQATFGGSGIPNTAVAVSTVNNQSGTVTLGLTATQRYANPALGNDGQGTFTALAGVDQTNATSISQALARWNIDYYVNGTSFAAAHTYNYRLLFDTDPSGGETFKTMNLSNLYATTLQDSWNIGSNASETLLGYNFNAMAPGAYSFRLEAYNGSGVADFASIVVNVGQVPEPASMALLGIGLLGMGAMRRKRA